MNYCGPAGLPHSHFLGGPAVWTDQDREKALAWQALKKATCSGCGTRRDEWNPDKGGDRRAYIADVDVCQGCAHVERMQNTASTDPSLKDRRGLKVILRRPKTPVPSP